MKGHLLQRTLGVASLLLIALLPACGNDAAKDATPATARSAEEVAALLVSPEALGEGWSIPSKAEYPFEGGIITEENRAMLPRIDLCADADAAAQETPSALDWQAFRQLDLDTGMPASGKPAPGKRPQHHLVFVQEYLLSDSESAVVTTYDDLSAGMAECATVATTTPDGEQLEAAPLDVPPVGDEATGLRYTMTEPGGGGAVWDMRNVVFRDGDLLVAATVVEITSPTIDAVLDDAAFARILDVMAGALS